MAATVNRNTAEMRRLQTQTGVTTGVPSLADLRETFYGGKLSQNDAIRAYLQSQLGVTTIQSLTDLWRMFFVSRGVANRVSLTDMATEFFSTTPFS